ncbi:vanadium-dependent haloperoxidase [Pontixanthobacter gangjinensis]|uniref:Vanadium-dependent haloperoxidase n=1 Tax=Christiangramia aestuarii TaxID=1028746 RepID=A0A7K1LNP2_9FLAO|nr:vanadium-dependent haloperoxidase [Christiangramia aestuarii]MUP42422.1 vanadium-dependent haloperoxidase [Christiangramia aestuarii]
MKTTLKFLGGLIILFGLGSCEKDQLDSTDPDLPNSADAKAIQNFNNGMINSYSSEVVVQWSELFSQSIDDRMPLPAESKIYAMVTLAMHDALNNVVPKYETYALDNSSTDASGITKKNIHTIADAAVSQAARDMIIQLFPASAAAANGRLDAILSGLEDSELKTRGIDIGKAAAAAVLAERAGDFPLTFQTYIGGTQPGEYRVDYEPFVGPGPFWPANAAYAFNMGDLTPFGIESSDQFLDEEPYSLDSAEYLKDYNETKALGCEDCPARTEEQTEIGAFWIESNASSMNRLARSLIEKRKLDGWEAARLLGLVEMAVIDAYIASFEGKAQYRFWRPVTAIRTGDSDGVEATVGDVNWTSSFFTPPTAEYPSTHAYAGGAAAAVFKAYFNSDHIDLEVTSPYYLPGVERHINSFSQMSYETAISRIYIGYHFRHAIEVGERQGKELGKYVFENNLRELKKV